MNSIVGWILAALFFLSTVFTTLMWLLTRRDLAENDGGPGAGAADAAGIPPPNQHNSALVSFERETEYQLLAVASINLDGQTKSHGVVKAVKGQSAAETFLVAHDMSHLRAGDIFKLHNNEPYKISERAAPAQSSAPAAAMAPAELSEGLGVSNDAQPKPVADDRTVMISIAAQAEDPLDIQAYLKALEGPDAGSDFPLKFSDNKVGRGDTNGIPLSDEGASRNHCQVSWNATAFRLEDLGSTNGTLCNESKVDTKVLEFGDRIKVSDSVLVFTCKGFELAEQNADQAISAFQKILDRQPDFLPALKNLAFLLERDVGRSAEADPLWKRISKLEKGA